MKDALLQKRIALALLFLLLVLLLTAGIYVLHASRQYTFIGGWAVDRDSRELDLRDTHLLSILGLLRLNAPERLDLRGCRLSVAQYERLAAAFPDCAIRWDIPVGAGRFDSLSRSVAVRDLHARDLPAVALFPALEEIDATACDDYAALAALTTAFPKLVCRWSIPLGGSYYPHDLTELTVLAADADAGELTERLGYFEKLEKLTVLGHTLSRAEQLALRAAYPQLALVCQVETVRGVWLPSDCTELALAGYGGFALSELPPLLPLFPALEVIDLTGCGFGNDELLSFRESLGGIDVRWRFNLCGASVCTTDTEIDLSNCAVEDVSEVEAALKYFPHVEKVIMCDCGVSDEEMQALDDRHEDVRFVWMVHFGEFFLRTDATVFIATTFPYGYTYLTNAQLWPLTYCRDLIALDLGHMHYSDTSFLAYLPKLQYLILADTNIRDLSPLAQMKDLYYLEIFLTQVTDISPLLECTGLRHLNIAFCPIRNTELLGEMTWLKRLRANGVNFTYAAYRAVQENLTDTEVTLYGGSSTDGTWRTDPAYFEMRDVFGVYYMPG